jgi:hypothetical protein
MSPIVATRAGLRTGCGVRARYVPDRTVNHGQPRSLADKSQHWPPALMQVTGLAVSAFQAGHEGSIPFARSNPKVQVTGVTTRYVLCSLRLNDRLVPHTCHTAAG